MRFIICILLLTSLLSTIAQPRIIDKVDDDYYQFPINPGQQNYLAGTVGEIRSSHFHTGIDVKTGGSIGLPVYAVTDGYISRIKISEGGYGHSLYMAHPNGTFSVYAHLDSYVEKVENWVRNKQYEKESYTIEMFPERNVFPFKKGEIIGYSGNTGSSSGPHLHFEIRDKDQRPMDILQFNFKEVRDHLAPIVKKIAFTTLDKDARVNHLFGRYEFDLIKVNNAYRTNVPIQLEGRIGVEIYSYDPMDGIPNKNGIIKTIMLVDNDTVFHENKEFLTFSRQRNILKHYNYDAYKRGSRRFNKLYLDEGNEHNIYLKTNKGLTLDSNKKITIFTEDSYSNLSISEIEINNNKVIYPPKTRFDTYEVIGNYIHFKSQKGVGVRLEDWRPVQPYYSDGKFNYYIWDMTDGIPESLFTEGETVETDLIAQIPSNQKVSYHHQDFEAVFGKRSLFDTLYLAYKKELDTLKNQEVFRFLNPTQPMRGNVEIKLRPQGSFDKQKSHVYSVLGRRRNYMGGTWNGDEITFKTRDLVSYTILTDSILPEIRPIKLDSKSIRIKINDKLSGVKSYKAKLNGSFLLMRYESKKDLIWAQPKNPNITLKGEFELVVEDNAGNKTFYSITL